MAGPKRGCLAAASAKTQAPATTWRPPPKPLTKRTCRPLPNRTVTA